jgi:hypothetical protein
MRDVNLVSSTSTLLTWY